VPIVGAVTHPFARFREDSSPDSDISATNRGDLWYGGDVAGRPVGHDAELEAHCMAAHGGPHPIVLPIPDPHPWDAEGTGEAAAARLPTPGQGSAARDELLTDGRLAAMARPHRQVRSWCEKCRTAWPCDVVRLVAEVRRLRRA
jgi:hypothetical protein